jgi:tetratricopeptide (TPR) repeat protein
MMQRSDLILFLFFFLLFTPVVWGQEGSAEIPSSERENRKLPESRLKGSMEEGARLIREKRWEEAIRLFEEMARRSPGQEEVYYHLGVSYLELGRFQKAEEALKRALRLNPEYTLAYLQLARLYEETQRLEEALSTYERIIEVDPMGEPAQFSLLKKSLIGGIFLARSGDFDGALRLFKSAAEIAPDDPTAHYNIGQVYLRKKDEAKAEEAFRKVVALDPRHQEAYLHLGNLYERQKRMEEALEAFVNAAQINPNSPGGKSAQAKVPLLQGILLAQRGKAEEALTAFRQALRISPDPASIYFNIAQVYLGQGDFENAEAALTRTLQVDPKHQEALLNLGILYERQGKLEEALRVYETARDAQPASADGVNAAVSAHTVRGRIAAQEGKLEEAVAEIREAVALQPKNPANHFNLALIYLQQNQLSEAEKAFDQVIALDPSEGDAYLRLADVLEKSRREQEAIETYERLIALGQGPLTTQAQIRLHLLKGVLFGRQQRFDEARSEFEEVIRLDPKEKMGYFNLALAHLKAKDIYASAETLKKAVEVDPGDTAIRLRLAGLYEEMGRPYDALDLYQGALEEEGEEGKEALFIEDIQERINLLFGTISVDYQTTYDSNVNLSETESSDLRSDLSAQYQRFFFFRAGWRTALRLSPSLSMYHRQQSLLFSGRVGLYADRRDYLTGGISLGYNYHVSLFEGSLSGQMHEFFLDRSWMTQGGSTLTASLRTRLFDSVANDAFDAVSPSISTSIGINQILGGRLTLSFGIFSSFNSQEVGDDYVNLALSPSISFDRPIAQGIYSNFSYGYSYAPYLHKDSLFNERRTNNSHNLTGGITLNVDRGFQVYLRGTWSLNRSTLPAAPPNTEEAITAERASSLGSYSKWFGTIGVRLQF